MTGADAIFLHLEQPDTPLHTLKVAVLDTARRERSVTLDELRRELSGRLGIIPRATQRVVGLPGFKGRPFWVDDPSFDIDDHLDERVLAPPGGRPQLDALYSELATQRLDRDRPLWSMTLVHGLESDQQAVVFRVHHAVTDGFGAVNSLLACTTASQGETVAPHSPAPAPAIGSHELYRHAARELGPWLRGAPSLVSEGGRGWIRARSFRATAPDLPPFLGARRNFCNSRGGAARACASGALAFADLRAVAKGTDTTVNGVLHAVVAGAMPRRAAGPRRGRQFADRRRLRHRRRPSHLGAAMGQSGNTYKRGPVLEPLRSARASPPHGAKLPGGRRATAQDRSRHGSPVG